MVRVPRKVRVLLLFVVVALLVSEVFRLGQGGGAWENPLKLFGTRDFIAFWAGIRVFLQGGNPYDDQLVLALQKPVHPQLVEAQVFLNPPWAILPMLPLGYLDFSLSSLLWILCNLCFWLGAIFAIVSILGGSSTQRSICGLIGALSMSAFFNVWMGQLSLAILFASLGALIGYRTKRDALVGFCLALLMVKPHLVFLFGLVVGLEFIRERRWRIPVWFLVFFGSMCIFPVLVRPGIYQEWLGREFSPLQWQTATVSALLRYLMLLLTGDVPSWPAFFMPLVGGLVFVFWYLRHERNIKPDQWFPSFAFLLLLSIICAPYGWLYDFCLLLPAQLFLVHAVLRSGISNYRRNMIVGLILFSQLGIGLTGYFTNVLGATVWVPLVVALAWSCSSTFSQTSPHNQRQ
jgi:hypothetical protein